MLEEDIVSEDECAIAVSVVTKNITYVDTYLGFRKPGTRKAWLRKQLEKYVPKDDDE